MPRHPVPPSPTDAYEALNARQRRFVDEYISNGGNGTQAARAAGYKGGENVLATVAKENIRKPQIARAIKERAKPTEDARHMGAQEVLARLSELSRQDEDRSSAVAALKVLTKCLGLEAARKVENTHTGGIIVTTGTADLAVYERERKKMFPGGVK